MAEDEVVMLHSPEGFTFADIQNYLREEGFETNIVDFRQLLEAVIWFSEQAEAQLLLFDHLFWAYKHEHDKRFDAQTRQAVLDLVNDPQWAPRLYALYRHKNFMLHFTELCYTSLILLRPPRGTSILIETLGYCIGYFDDATALDLSRHTTGIDQLGIVTNDINEYIRAIQGERVDFFEASSDFKFVRRLIRTTPEWLAEALSFPKLMNQISLPFYLYPPDLEPMNPFDYIRPDNVRMCDLLRYIAGDVNDANYTYTVFCLFTGLYIIPGWNITPVDVVLSVNAGDTVHPWRPEYGYTEETLNEYNRLVEIVDHRGIPDEVWGMTALERQALFLNEEEARDLYNTLRRGMIIADREFSEQGRIDERALVVEMTSYLQYNNEDLWRYRVEEHTNAVAFIKDEQQPYEMRCALLNTITNDKMSNLRWFISRQEEVRRREEETRGCSLM